MSQERYIRQILLDSIGQEGQTKLRKAKVTIIGCGGLGSIAAPYLAGAGVGEIVLVDNDRPHVSNLHRQIVYSAEKSKHSKAEYLKEHLNLLNPEINVIAVNEMLTKDNISKVVADCDVVLECTDDIQVKYMVNDYCHFRRIPIVYGAIHKFVGYVSFFENKDEHSIHLRDIFAEPNLDIPSCSEVGVLGSIAGMIGILQANEALKFVLGIGRVLNGQLLTYDILENSQMKVQLKKVFLKDMKQLFESTTYNTVSCGIHEITWSTIQENRLKYKLISILEDQEHQDIDAQVERSPLSLFDYNQAFPNNQEVVYYCLSGKRSLNLVNRLKADHPNRLVYSLQGGLKNYDR